ncbi:MAG TPA: phage holin family protein [Saprospiraceae bacterium]|nr:phage holin family protein [Saprospiraceae bacterium]HPI07205.1 phage holin family protein [Saprospiraceae bacterium]
MDNTIQENVEDLVDHIQEYIETQKELFVIGAKEKAAAAISQTIVWIMVGLFAFLGVAFLSIALAMWLGHLLGNFGYGFLIVGVLYGIGAALFYTFRESLLLTRLNDLFLIKFMSNHEQH